MYVMSVTPGLVAPSNRELPLQEIRNQDRGLAERPAWRAVPVECEEIMRRAIGAHRAGRRLHTLTEQDRARCDPLLISRGLDAVARFEWLGGDGPYVLQAARRLPRLPARARPRIQLAAHCGAL
jgi:predicted RNA polymerase sigma factor